MLDAGTTALAGGGAPPPLLDDENDDDGASRNSGCDDDDDDDDDGTGAIAAGVDVTGVCDVTDALALGDDANSTSRAFCDEQNITQSYYFLSNKTNRCNMY